jgi:hypothetical protein
MLKELLEEYISDLNDRILEIDAAILSSKVPEQGYLILHRRLTLKHIAKLREILHNAE